MSMYSSEVESIINHLMLHQYLVGDGEENLAKIDEYVKMVKDISYGTFILPKNPVDRAIAIAFQLVIENRMNPWRIDLKKFVELYMDRIKNDEIIDFITVGKIILMAWSILQLKTEDAIERISAMKDINNTSDIELTCQSDISSANDYDSQKLVENKLSIEHLPVLREPVRRYEKKKVSLMELIEALESTRKLIKNRDSKLKENSIKNINITERIHDEEERDVSRVWEKICSIDRESLSMMEILENHRREEFLRVFISLLFLMKNNKIVLEQDMPFGIIRIKIVSREGKNEVYKVEMETSEITASY